MPTAPPPAKPAKPAPSSAPPAAPQTPNPATGFQPSARQSANDDLDATFGPSVTPAKASEAPKPVETPKTAPDASKTASEAPAIQPESADEYLIDPVKPAADPSAARPAEPAKESVKDPEPQPVKAPELRAAYAKSKARVAELEKQLKEVQAKPVDDTERKTFTEQISTLNKKLEEASTSLKFAAYEQSQEYKDKYETPFVEAWNEGVQQVAGLTVTTADGVRKGTPEDFQTIMRESDNERAATMATELFGSNAFYVLASRRELVKLNNSRVKALGEFKATMADRAKAEAETSAKTKSEMDAARIQRITTFKKLNEEAANKYPDLFAPLEGDEEGNKILEKDYKHADLAFSGGNGLTPDQLIKLHSAIRNKAGGFGRLVYRLKQRDAKIAELEKQLEEIRGSTPGDGQVGKTDQPPKEMSAFDELEQLAKR